MFGDKRIRDQRPMTHITVAPDHATPTEPQGSPFFPKHLVDLFFRPRRFFNGTLALGKTPYVYAVTWCYGMSAAIERIDRELLKESVGSSRANPVFENLGILTSWAHFWGFVLVTGIISGFLIWAIGGWWYRLRITWSGVVEPDKRMAHLVFVYASFVYNLPALLVTLVHTTRFANYREAFNADELYSLIVLVFLFWSLIVSYRGVRTVFNASKWRARLWFIILPALLYLIAFGGLGVLLALREVAQGE